MEFKYILFCKLSFCRSTHFLCQNTNIPRSEKHILLQQRNCFPSYPDHYLNEMLRAVHSCGTVYESL